MIELDPRREWWSVKVYSHSRHEWVTDAVFPSEQRARNWVKWMGYPRPMVERCEEVQ